MTVHHELEIIVHCELIMIKVHCELDIKVHCELEIKNRFGMLFKCNVIGDDSSLLIFNQFQVKYNESTLNARYGWYTCFFLT